MKNLSEKSVAQIAAEARTKLGLSQKELAKTLGYTSHQRISQWENPKEPNHHIALPVFRKLAQMVGDNPDEYEKIFKTEKIKRTYFEAKQKLQDITGKNYLLNEKQSEYNNTPAITIKQLPTKFNTFTIKVNKFLNIEAEFTLTCKNKKPKENQLALIVLNKKESIVMPYNSKIFNTNNTIIYPIINIKPE